MNCNNMKRRGRRMEFWMVALMHCTTTGAHANGTADAAASASSLTLVSSTLTTVAPAALTLTATVSGTALKGNIIFKSGGNKIGTGVINKNTATLTLALPPAIHGLAATFPAPGGDIVSPTINVVVDNALSCL